MRNTQRSQTRTTKRKHSVSGTYQTHMRADRHTQNQDWTSSTVAHISFLTVNDSWCLGFKIPYECIDLPLCFSATHETNEDLARWRKEGGKSIPSPTSRFTAISRCHYACLCFWVCVSLSLAVKLNDGAGLSSIDHEQRLRALSTDGGVYDSTGPRVSPFHPSRCLPVGQWRKKCEKNRWKERGGRENKPLDRSIITTLTY